MFRLLPIDQILLDRKFKIKLTKNSCLIFVLKLYTEQYDLCMGNAYPQTFRQVFQLSGWFLSAEDIEKDKNKKLVIKL